MFDTWLCPQFIRDQLKISNSKTNDPNNLPEFASWYYKYAEIIFIYSYTKWLSNTLLNRSLYSYFRTIVRTIKAMQTLQCERLKDHSSVCGWWRSFKLKKTFWKAIRNIGDLIHQKIILLIQDMTLEIFDEHVNIF